MQIVEKYECFCGEEFDLFKFDADKFSLEFKKSHPIDRLHQEIYVPLTFECRV